MIRKIFVLAALCLLLTACGSKTQPETAFEITGQMQLSYADKFSVDYCADGCAVINIADDKFLLVPENTDIPEYAGDMTVLKQPLEPIYLPASAAMDLFDALGALDSVKFTSTDVNSWSLPVVKKAMEDGKIMYAGKYNAPDYELLASENCGIAIESTMINHSPETKEQLEMLGIPVLTEHSSYEEHPMGRLEWIKLYGLLTGREEAAQKYFDEKDKAFKAAVWADVPENERKTAAFFYISSNGYVNIRKPGDYISKMIELAGGKYIFTADKLNVEENALSTMNIQLEEFYSTAKDADILIYNSTIAGELEGIDGLLAINPVFADFKAVKNGNVWCTEKNMFQQTTGAAETVSDLNMIFAGKADDKDELVFLHRLK